MGEDVKREEVEERVPLIPSLTMTRRERSRFWLVALAALALWWLVSHSWQALGPFIFGLILAYLMLPLVDMLGRAMPRAVAIIFVYLAFGLLIWALVSWATPTISKQIGELADNIPGYEEQVQEWAGDALQWYNSLPIPDDVRQALENGLRNSLNFVASAAQTALVGTVGFISRAFGVIVGFVIIPFWLFYVLLDKEKGIAALNRMLPRTWRGDVWRILRIINGILGRYIRGQLILGVVVGVATTIGLLIVGAPYPFLLGVISGMTELVPVLGPIIGAVPGLVLAAFSQEGWVMVVKVLVVYVVVQQLENNLLVPKIQGDSVKLHPAIIMVALVVGSQVAGLGGLIVAVPVAAIIRDVYLYLYRRHAEGLEPRAAEASVPSRYDEGTTRGLAEQARALARNNAQPGINTGDEMIEELEEERARSDDEEETVVPGRGAAGGSEER